MGMLQKGGGKKILKNMLQTLLKGQWQKLDNFYENILNSKLKIIK